MDRRSSVTNDIRYALELPLIEHELIAFVIQIGIGCAGVDVRRVGRGSP